MTPFPVTVDDGASKSRVMVVGTIPLFPVTEYTPS